METNEVPATLANVGWRPPLLTSERTLMRGWELRDAESVFTYASDPEVTRYMFWDRHRTVADAHSFLTMVAGEYEREELGYALCLRSAPDVAIGGLGVFWRGKQHKVMELGYVMAREHWGQGLLPEAARLLVSHAFATRAVERIYAPILAENAKSRRAAEKIGMRFEGVLRSSLELRGRRWDQAVYSVLRADLG